MVDEFYATIKLITGEEIFGLVSVEEDTENPIILITHPVTMKMINAIEGSMVKLNTWLNVPGDDPVVIKWDKGKSNLADYYTKHHPIHHHKTVRPLYNLDGDPTPNP